MSAGGPAAGATPDDLWIDAATQGARGDYSEAAALCRALADHGGRWRSLALSMRASHHRQVGAIVTARALDVQALDSADDDESCADALIGLAADDVAAGAASTAQDWHAQAGVMAANGWRTLTRWHWVGAELALLVGDRGAAADHARASVACSAEESHRHEAKSLIIVAAATGDPTGLDRVATVLEASSWPTLQWPLALVAADLGDRVDPVWLARAWHAGADATYRIEERLPAGLVATWRAQPGVGRLRAGSPGRGGE
ncbi:MAG: hypothetical protein ACO3JT_02300 [Candidatus Nanopelagicales bacterium]